ncbi:cyclic nucleotide-binding domain-containing protein [Runella sp. CRIBMP]|uniref:Crp/Fnr family transcriptional regulator n=1 Tax=Runella sp. CRIBMP TaxID=2683261 RepID=UPI0014122F90|nr:Crp/Fnr family transcriptional regulator [Runella sp. CRIBMP]NBB22012.1 cyclic nucleotide-binding domain-containing protein [Runella sp. CRIBMP]
MQQSLFPHLQHLIGLTNEEFDIFLGCLQSQKLKRREVLIAEGDICRYAYFIKKGCLRYFHNVDGEEITGQFFFENGWYTDYESFLLQKPSKQNIDALEPTELILLPKSELLNLYITIPKFEKFGRIMAENAFLGLRNRTELLTQQSAEERYLRLMKERPKVIERVPQHYIASYLGIKPPSLSRIRKRIMNNT